MKKNVLIGMVALSLVLSSCSKKEQEEPAETQIFEPVLQEKVEKTSDSTQEEEEEVVERPLEDYIDYKVESGLFELPLSGSTGYATITTSVKLYAVSSSTTVATLKAGESFTIVKQVGQWWEIDVGEVRGWIEHTYAMINLPDVLPSMIYDNANGYASYMQSQGKTISNVTGQKLYDTYYYNERLGEMEYAVPVAYGMAKKIALAQAAALKDGNTLIMVESYRPYTTQMLVVKEMTNLVNSDAALKASISAWGLNWFIATGISNHQRGLSIDVSLGKVLDTEICTTGDYKYTKVTSMREHTMPTPIHDLHPDSASLAKPVSSTTNAWETTELAPNMNSSAVLMRKYCTDAGMTPIASEWWHFDDHYTKAHSSNTGGYLLSETVSVAPYYWEDMGDVIKPEPVYSGVTILPEAMEVEEEDLEWDGYWNTYPGETASVESEQPTVEPEIPDVEPVIPEVAPEIPYEEPESPYVEPESSYVEPEIPYVEPEISYVEPENPYVEPEISYVEPEITVNPEENNWGEGAG